MNDMICQVGKLKKGRGTLASKTSLGTLLGMEDAEVFELIDDEYGLSIKQQALHKIMHDMMEQVERIRKREKKMASELKQLKAENANLRNLLKEKPK